MAVEPQGVVRVFYCYAHADKELRFELAKHLSPLKRLRYIYEWSDRDIQAGMKWEQEIARELNSADIILLLISPDFMYSNYCYGLEMRRALERHQANEAHVIPIILRPVDWKSTPIGELQVLPTEGTPVTSWSDRDEAFQDVVEGITIVCNSFLFLQWMKKGDAYYRDKNFEQAIESYDQALYYDLSPTLYIRKGSALLRLGRYEEALFNFEQLLGLDPAAVGAAHYGKYITFMAMGLLGSAEQVRKRAQKLDYDSYLP